MIGGELWFVCQFTGWEKSSFLKYVASNPPRDRNLIGDWYWPQDRSICQYILWSSHFQLFYRWNRSWLLEHIISVVPLISITNKDSSDSVPVLSCIPPQWLHLPRDLSIDIDHELDGSRIMTTYCWCVGDKIPLAPPKESILLHQQDNR